MDRNHTNSTNSLSRGAVGRLLFLMAAVVLFLIAARPVLAGDAADEGAGQEEATNVTKVTKVTPTESVDLYDTSRMPRKIR